MTRETKYTPTDWNKEIEGFAVEVENGTVIFKNGTRLTAQQVREDGEKN